LSGAWADFASLKKPSVADGQARKKHAACFARRVKRASQKYSSFRESEIMI
jgi:hypothetical protein